MKPSRLPSHTWLAAFAGLLLGLLCYWVLRGGERRAIHDTASSLPSRGDSSQSKSAPLVTGPMTAFLRAIPEASALECESMALECLEQRQHGKEIELEARAAAELPAGKARDFMMDAICQIWAAHDHEAALRYANEHGLESTAITSLRNRPTDEMRETVLSAPEEHFAKLFDPDGAGRDRARAAPRARHGVECGGPGRGRELAAYPGASE